MTEWKWIKITNSSVFSLLFNQLSTKFGISCFSLMRNKEISEFFYLMIRGEKTHFKKNQIVFRISSQFNSEAKKQKQTFFFHFLHDKVNFQHNLSLSVHFKQEEYLSIIISQISEIFRPKFSSWLTAYQISIPFTITLWFIDPYISNVVSCLDKSSLVLACVMFEERSFFLKFTVLKIIFVIEFPILHFILHFLYVEAKSKTIWFLNFENILQFLYAKLQTANFYLHFPESQSMRILAC